MSKDRCCYLGVGKWWVQPYDDRTAPWTWLGHLSKADQKPTIQKINLPNLSTPGGGNSCSKERVSDIAIDLTFQCHKDINLATFFGGDLTEIVAGSPVVDEPGFAYAGGIWPLKNAAPGSVIVSNAAGVGGTPYTLGADYVITASGLAFPSGTTIPAPSGLPLAPNIFVDYTPQAQSVIQGYRKTGKSYRILFDGLNDDEGKAVVGRYHNAKFGVAKSFNVIGSAFNTVDIEAELLDDDTILDPLKSKKFEIAFAN